MVVFWVLVAVVLVVLVLLGVRALRGRRAAPAELEGRPRVGEIWIADVPFADGTGSKVRPCLIVRPRRSGADVLKITSQDKHNRPDHVQIETHSWDTHATHNSWLDLSTALHVTETGLHRPVGRLQDTRVLNQVTRRYPARRAA